MATEATNASYRREPKVAPKFLAPSGSLAATMQAGHSVSTARRGMIPVLCTANRPADIGAAPVDLELELIFDMAKMPDSFIVHAATENHNAPLICRGEIVVIDTGGPCITGGWMPTEGGLFLIEYRSPPTAGERYARHSRSIVQTFTDQRGRWWAGGLRRGGQRAEMFCADGPYTDELALADKLIGRVVGLYRQSGTVQ